MPNRLAHESSPYLKQHANNPVDWYPWGREALDKAKREDKPIFLSIGYSACHWCHVMEKESFEDQATADVLNEHFINIKVDREERQDLDHIYMSAVQVMTQHGGWPMSVFLTPTLRPFYGGTYFPPTDRHGMPSFKRVLLGVAQAWKTKKSEILQTANQLTEALQQIQEGSTEGPGNADLGLVALAAEKALSNWDKENGGFGSAPKFFHTTDLRVLLRHYFQTKHAESLNAVVSTLRKISSGGIYDQLGGGFHRYSTDPIWLVPHFEKMLYDNALLAIVFLEAFQLTQERFLSRTASEVLDYVLREMTSEEGGFFSTQDADSEGEEGKFYVWSRQEVVSTLGDELGKTFCEIYQMSEHGNWEGKNIPHLQSSLEEIAAYKKLELNWLEDELALAKRKLLAERNRRIAPHRDEKVVLSWNGMMIEAMAFGYQVLHDPRYLEAARNSARFVLDKMRSEGKLLHVYKDGVSKLDAYLDDYATTISALTTLFEATGEEEWLNAAAELADRMVTQFYEQNDFYFTAKDHESLIARPRERHDGATPSATGMAVTALARLGRLLEKREFVEIAEQALKAHAASIRSMPQGSGQFLVSLFHLQHEPREVAVVGASGDEKEEILSYLWSQFAPSRVLAWSQNPSSNLNLLKGRTSKSGPAVFVCENYSCKTPVHSVAELKQLGL